MAAAPGPEPPRPGPVRPREPVAAPDPLAEVRREAEALLAAAREEARRIREAAEREGRQAGEAAGRAEAEARAAAWEARARRAWRTAWAVRRALLGSLAGDVARVARALAEQVLGRELEASPEEVVGLARRLLAEAGTRGELVVHPDDVPLFAGEALPPGVRLRGDPAVGPGGARFESEAGAWDASLTGRWHRVLRALPGGEAHGDG